MIRLYIGTSEAPGSMSLHEVDGQSIARIRLKEPIIAAYGDRFIIRSATPAQTLGGGFVLNPSPIRRFSEECIRLLLANDPSAHVSAFTKDAGLHGIARKTLISRFALLPSVIDKTIQDLLSRGELIRFDTQSDLYVSTEHFNGLKAMITSEVKDYHTKNPSTPGIPKEHLRTALKGIIDARLFHKALRELTKTQTLEEDGPLIRQKHFTASLGQAGDQTENLHAILEQAGLEPPNHQDLAQMLAVDKKKLMQILAFMAREGKLVKIKEDIFLTTTHEEVLRERVREFLIQHQLMNPNDVKNILGVSRKYAIPYMEYLDRIKFTARIGNERKLFGSH